jgi:hypothetical protein
MQHGETSVTSWVVRAVGQHACSAGHVCAKAAQDQQDSSSIHCWGLAKCVSMALNPAFRTSALLLAWCVVLGLTYLRSGSCCELACSLAVDCGLCAVLLPACCPAGCAGGAAVSVSRGGSSLYGIPGRVKLQLGVGESPCSGTVEAKCSQVYSRSTQAGLC